MTRMEAITTARTMYAGGWKIDQIRIYLRKHGVKTSWARVKMWVDDEYAERYRRRERDRSRRRNREINGVKSFRVLDQQARETLVRELAVPATAATAELTPDLLIALRLEDGLTYPTIAKVVRRFFGENVTENQVRLQLAKLGAPKNPNKARAARTQNARRKAAA